MGSHIYKVEGYPETKKWLNHVGKNSYPQYKSALKLYCEYRELNPTELIDEVELDRKKSRREIGAPENKLLEFHKWLLTEYKKRKGRGRPIEPPKIGVAKTKAAGYFNAMRSFYKANGYPLNCKSPKAQPKDRNEKLRLTPEQVKQLIDHAPTIRDRAIIAMIFQAGFDVSTICGLKYGHVKNELERGDDPICINVVRGKEEVKYFTFIGKDSIELLKAYLTERKDLKMESPLFTKEGAAKKKGARITPNLIQNMLRDVAVKSGVVTEEHMGYADMNPARPHALRASFSTILALNGWNQTLIDFMQGHKIAYNGAYFNPQPEQIREMYQNIEDKLSITKTSKSIRQLEARVRELESRLTNIESLLGSPELVSIREKVKKEL